MSLDVYLIDPTATYADCLYNSNITHNLGEMATRAGIYEALWRPYRLREDYNVPAGDHRAEQDFEDSVTVKARDIVDVVERGLKDLKERPDYFRQFDSPSGWGRYDDFVLFVKEYLAKLKKYPESIVATWR